MYTSGNNLHRKEVFICEVQMFTSLYTEFILTVIDNILFIIEQTQCKVQPHYASLGYPFHNTVAHT